MKRSRIVSWVMGGLRGQLAYWRANTLVAIVALLSGMGLPLIPWAAVTACGSSTHARAKAGALATLDCSAPALREAVSDVAPWALGKVLMAIKSDGTADSAVLREAMARLRSDVGRCAFAAALATLSAPRESVPGVTQQALWTGGPMVDTTALRAVFVAARIDLGWPPIRAGDAVF